MALQLTGGYWKLEPTVASGASITFIRSGVKASGPATKEKSVKQVCLTDGECV